MFCKKCQKTIRVISKFIDTQLTESLETAGMITAEVAKVINNPLFQLSVSMLPANSDTTKVLATIEKVLTISNNLAECTDKTGLDRINCLMHALNLLPAEERNSALLRLNSALTAMQDGNRYEQYVYDTAAQMSYFNDKVLSGRKIEIDGEQRPAEKMAVVLPALEMIESKANETTGQANHIFAKPIDTAPAAAAATPKAF